MIYTRKLLDDSEIKTIQSILPNINWIDGINSGGEDRKKNDQGSPKCKAALEIDAIVIDSIRRDDYFSEVSAPNKTQTLMVTKTYAGGYYLPHIDMAFLGDYSTTVFLNDEYEGGELELYIDGAIKSIKLPAGHAVTYNTGTPHTVNKVTSGCRYVGVTWTQSLFKDIVHREIYSDIQRAMNNLTHDCVGSVDTLDGWVNDPMSILSSVSEKMKRYYGRSE